MHKIARLFRRHSLLEHESNTKYCILSVLQSKQTILPTQKHSLSEKKMVVWFILKTVIERKQI